MRRLAAVALAVLALAGCTKGSDAGPSIPQVTVGGVSDPQPSLAPNQVLAARTAAGIEACPVARATSTAPSDGLPQLVLPCLGGDTKVNLAALPTGKPRVINIWAQWCGPCTEEAPYLGAVWKKVRGRVDFLGVNYSDPDTGKVIDFAKHYGLTYPELVDVDRASQVPLRIGGGSIPQTIFVDAQGHIVHHEFGAYSSADALQQAIAQYLGVTP